MSNLKKWQIAASINNDILSRFPELNPVLLQLLWNRGLTNQEAIDEFLNPDWGQDIHDPFLFRDMKKAVERIYEIIGDNQKIGVFGDYDADGVCAAVILVLTLRKLGASIEIYLPHREREGYGLNEEAIRYFQEKKIRLMITCDCGVTNVKQIDYALKLGIQTIVTDHHQPSDLFPPALAILHPSLHKESYPFKLLSGGGVAFKLVQGLLRYEGCQLSEIEKEAHEKWLTELVAISTIADMVKLVGENRTLTKYGLQVLRKTKRLGLRKLVEIAGLRFSEIDSWAISWQLAPRINAAGRMDHANAAYALLTSEDEQEATELARSINLANTERQTVTETMLAQAIEQIGEPPTKSYLVQAFQPGWPLGLVGLVAGKLVSYYNRPALVMCQSGDKIAGSGRAGIGNFDLAAALKKCSELLISYGGHKEAAGFSLKKENFELFIAKMQDIAAEYLIQEDLTPVLDIDAVLHFSQITWELAELILQMEPVGQGNPLPKFVSLGVKVINVQPVGGFGQHWRIELEQNGVKQKFIWFRAIDREITLFAGNKIDVAYEIGINQWNDIRQLELKIVDIRKIDS